jgi:outer membrane protein OmpA-like peptidoglycan-associated protein
MTVPMPYSLTLHGVTRSFEANLAVTVIDDSRVSVATTTPIAVAAGDFNLSEGVKKLEEAANVVIIPNATVSFDFVFQRNGTAAAPATASAPALAAQAPADPASVALEAEGDFDLAACTGRFEILSRSGNIFFRSGSARLDPASAPLLDSLAEIIARCPGLTIEVSGHTDSDGGEAANQALSEARARAVADYLEAHSVAAGRLVVVGHGEARPITANDSAENKARNRRIEFAVAGG